MMGAMQDLGVEALELSEPTVGIWPRTPWTDPRPLLRTEGWLQS